MQDLPFMNAGIRDLKAKRGEFGIEIIQGIMRDTGLHENNWGRDDGIEEPYWKPL